MTLIAELSRLAGEAFAAGGQGNIRLCFASGAERLSKGLDRIEAAIKAL